MLETVKLALRIKSDAFNNELLALINAAKDDLLRSGVEELNTDLYNLAVITFCRANFGDNEKSKQLLELYDKQKSMMIITGED
ncbi:hypothetical protein FACS1894132_09730 [Clostridia bacterium]|nr:hypothetical protein FACS1894132_09730 [Clostridia bacterium]